MRKKLNKNVNSNATPDNDAICSKYHCLSPIHQHIIDAQQKDINMREIDSLSHQIRMLIERRDRLIEGL
jgi:hypothetical protein